MRRVNSNLDGNKMCLVCLLVCGFALTSGLGLLHAQQPGDLPSKPEPAPNAASRNGSVSPPQTLTFGMRLKIYERSFISPESVLGPAFGAGIGQARNTPPEWEQGAAGYGRRFASGYARSVIGRTIGFGVAVVDHEDTRFVPSNEHGIWRRTQHAVVGTFVSPTTGGGRIPAFSRFAGVYGAAFISNAWQPPSQDTNVDALVRGTTALASSVGWHVFAEFWPDIRKALHRKR